MYDPFAQFHTTVLPNGLTVHCLHMPERESVRVRIIVKSGSFHDPIEKEGLAHFVEHMVSKNALLPYEQLRKRLENLGVEAKFGATGSWDTSYAFNGIQDKSALGEAFRHYGYMLTCATLYERIETERTAIIGEYHRKFPMNVEAELRKNAHKALFANGHMGRTITPLGWPETVAKITKEDLQLFYDEHYVPANIEIVCVGGVDLEHLVAFINETDLSKEKPGVRAVSVARDLPIEPLSTNYEDVRFAEMYGIKVEKAHFESVARYPGDTPTFAMNYLGTLVGEEFAQELRGKRGWSYAPVVKHDDDVYIQTLSFRSDRMPAEHVDEVERILSDIIARVPDMYEEFARIKKRDAAQAALYDPSMESILRRAHADLKYLGFIESRATTEARRNATTFDDVLALLPYLEREKRWTRIERP